MLWGMANVILGLRKAMEKVKDPYTNAILAAAKAAETKLQDLYKKAARSDPVIIATAVDPRFRMYYFVWAEKNNITGNDTAIREHAYIAVKNVFTEYWNRRNKEARNGDLVTHDEGAN